MYIQSELSLRVDGNIVAQSSHNIVVCNWTRTTHTLPTTTGSRFTEHDDLQSDKESTYIANKPLPNPLWIPPNSEEGEGRLTSSVISSQMVMPTLQQSSAQHRVRPISLLRFWISEGLSQFSIKYKGWNSHVHREFPGNFESLNLSRNNIREIGRTTRLIRHGTLTHCHALRHGQMGP